MTEFEIGIGTEIGIEIGIRTEIRIEIGFGKLIDYLFLLFIYYILVLPVGVHMPHQRPPGRVIYGFTMTNWPRGFYVDPMTFEYFLAIENTQRTKPSWQRMNNLT